MKRICTSLCSLLLSIAMQASVFTVNGIKYGTDLQDGLRIWENEYEGFVIVLGLEDQSYIGSLVIPESVTYNQKGYKVKYIDYKAFKDCEGLISVTIPNTVVGIGRYAFQGCVNLTQLNIPPSVMYVYFKAFENTAWYNSQPDGILYKDNVLFGYKGEQPEGHLDISKGTRVIAEYAFKGCFDVTSITIPSTVMSICQGAFFETDISTIVLPEILTNLELQAFDCPNLETIYSKISEPFEIQGPPYGPFGSKEFATLYVPAGTKAKYQATEGWNMFENIEEMEYESEPYEVDIKNDQTVVIKSMRVDKTGKLTIPEKVEVDGVEYTVTEIAEDAFKGNTDLTEVTIPGTVTTIGAGAFEGCTNLKAIYVLSPTPASLAAAVSSRAQHKVASTTVSQFEGIDFETCVLYVPFGSEQAYREAEGWKEFRHIVGVHGETDLALTVTANSYSREYGEENPVFEFTTEGATLDGEPVIECEATPASPVGTYNIIVKKGGVKNYNDTYVKGTLTITKAPLTVKVEDAEREQGKENPQFVLTYTGWKNNETESVLTKKPMATTTATKDSPAGVYDIVVNGGEAQNYTLSYVSGKLTVTVPSGIYDATHQMDNGQWTMDDWYDLSGRKLNHGLKSKGVYIVNGRKVVIK